MVDADATLTRREHAPGDAAGGLQRTAAERRRLGVLLILLAAGISLLLSVGLWFSDNREEGLFVGLWVPSILAAGALWMTATTAARP